MIALLCAGGRDRDVIQEIVKKISQAPNSEQADLAVQLLALAQARGIRALIEQEINSMPITVNIEDIPLLREPFERVQARSRQEGRAAAIDRLLRRKFPSDIPARLAEHLANLPPESLDEIIDNCATALSVSDALGRYAPKG